MIWENVLALVQLTVGYGLLCVLLPSLCLHDYVADKPLTYRFFFYQTCANVYLILWGYLLAFVRCFNTFTLWAVLVILPLAVTAWRKRAVVTVRAHAAIETVQTVLSGMYGLKTLWRDAVSFVRRRCKQIYQRYIKGHIPELLGLCAVFAVILVLYGQYHLTHDGYAYGDEYFHYYWAQELLYGNSFPSGMYPHAMHFLVAALSGMFGFRLLRIYLIFGCFNTCLLFATFYLLLKKTFSSRTAVLSGIAFFLLTNIFVYVVYHRYQISLPMEAGLIPFCIMLYAILHYIRSQDKHDIVLFALSVGWCIHTHFYSAIAAALTCLVFGIVFLAFVLKKKLLFRLIAAGLAGVLIGVVPFGVGYALGYPFEQSMDWAIGVIEGNEDKHANQFSQVEQLQEQTREDLTLEQFVDEGLWTVETRGAKTVLLCLDAGMLLFGLLGAICSKKKRFQYLLYLFWGLNWLVYLAGSTGVVTLIQRERFGVFFGFFTIPLFVFPAQLLYDAFCLARLKPRYAETGLVAAALAFFFFMAEGGFVKTDFTVETSIMAEGDIKTCYRLIDEYPKDSWTVVSTTYDLAIVRHHGYHYEIIDLMTSLDAPDEDSIYIPTKDIFVIVETKIDQYDEQKFRRDSHGGANIFENRGDPTPEKALAALPDQDEFESARFVQCYFYPWRSVVMSKLYYWMEKVKEIYPSEVSVFYQDEIVTVYRIHQDEYFPLNLKLNYQSGLQ